jgi:ubiquinone/menaquinone biosynthesis C-methylase UbiE
MATATLNRDLQLSEAPMQSVSQYNQATKFTYELRESRLKKCVRLMEPLPPGKMLDIGCSTGDWALYWQSRGWTPGGVDIDREHVEIARERGVDARYCDLNCQPIPFENRVFDLIFAGEVIEHLVDTDGFLQELNRCCRPNGHLLLTTPNLASFENRIRLLFGIYPKWLNYNLCESGHVRGYTPGMLKKQLAAHDFQVVRQLGNWVPFIPQHFVDDIKMPSLAVTGDLLPSLAMDIIVLARKRA